VKYLSGDCKFSIGPDILFARGQCTSWQIQQILGRSDMVHKDGVTELYQTLKEHRGVIDAALICVRYQVFCFFLEQTFWVESKIRHSRSSCIEVLANSSYPLFSQFFAHLHYLYMGCTLKLCCFIGH